MDKRIIFSLLIVTMLFACNKDKCTGVNMCENDRGVFVGTWRWYKTSVKEWFDIGPPIYHDYTPTNQGFEYYFNVTADGKFEGYRNSELETLYTLSSVSSEGIGSANQVLSLYIDCGSQKLGFVRFTSNTTNDTIWLNMKPFRFVDEENHLESGYNYFVRE